MTPLLMLIYLTACLGFALRSVTRTRRGIRTRPAAKAEAVEGKVFGLVIMAAFLMILPVLYYSMLSGRVYAIGYYAFDYGPFVVLLGLAYLLALSGFIYALAQVFRKRPTRFLMLSSLFSQVLFWVGFMTLMSLVSPVDFPEYAYRRAPNHQGHFWP